MRMRGKFGLATVAGGILVAIALVLVLVSETVLPFTDHLRQDALAGDGEHTVRFFQDEEEEKVASVYVSHGQVKEDIYRMMVEVAHPGKTVLDSSISEVPLGAAGVGSVAGDARGLPLAPFGVPLCPRPRTHRWYRGSDRQYPRPGVPGERHGQAGVLPAY